MGGVARLAWRHGGDSKHLKNDGFSLICNTYVELWPRVMANDGFLTIPLATKSRLGCSRFPPSYRHSFDKFLHALVGTIFVLICQHLALESIPCAMAMWLQPNTMA